MRGSSRTVGALLLLALVVGACRAEGQIEGDPDAGDDTSVESPEGFGDDPEGDVEIDAGLDLGEAGLVARDNQFEPAEFSIVSGDAFELTNQGEAPHNFTLEEAGIDEDVDPGGSTTITVDAEPGTYEFVCEYHEADGMVGTVTVE